jgi:hypothetical protein
MNWEYSTEFWAAWRVIELVEDGHQHDADHQPDRKILE